jgi:hypothetical protein
MDNPAFYILTYILATIAVIILITDSSLCIWSYTNPTLKNINPDATGDVSIVEVDHTEKKNSLSVSEKYSSIEKYEDEDDNTDKDESAPIGGSDETCVPEWTVNPILTPENCFLHTDSGCNGIGADNMIDPEKLDGGYVGSKNYDKTCNYDADNLPHKYMSDAIPAAWKSQNFEDCSGDA